MRTRRGLGYTGIGEEREGGGRERKWGKRERVGGEEEGVGLGHTLGGIPWDSRGRL